MTRSLLRIAVVLLSIHGMAIAQEAHQHDAPGNASSVPTGSPSESPMLPVPTVPEDASQKEHVAPLPPSSTPAPGSHEAMAKTMGMDDRARIGFLRFDRAEYRQDGAFAWDADAWYGGDYDRLWLKTEGEREQGNWDGRIEALWSRVVSRWWSTQVGIRRDFGEGHPRTWLAAGVEGLAPYFFDVEATAYVSDQGRLAARFSASYDLLFTQRLVLQPEFDFAAFSKTEPELRQGSGISSAAIAVRLRYEIRRELAPYAGVEWARAFGKTAELLRADGESSSDVRWVAGIRFWF